MLICIDGSIADEPTFVFSTSPTLSEWIAHRPAFAFSAAIVFTISREGMIAGCSVSGADTATTSR